MDLSGNALTALPSGLPPSLFKLRLSNNASLALTMADADALLSQQQYLSSVHLAGTATAAAVVDKLRAAGVRVRVAPGEGVDDHRNSGSEDGFSGDDDGPF